MEKPFLAKVLPRLTKSMGADYPELVESQARIAELLTLEEEGFLRTLQRGGNLLNKIIDAAHKHGNRISGEDAFKLKDTYGFPVEEIELLARDAGLTIDLKKYEELEKEARERSKRAHKKAQQMVSDTLFADIAEKSGATTFTGYDSTTGTGKVIAIVVEGQLSDVMTAGQEGLIILDQTPFYAEKGGQVGDTGFLRKNEEVSFEVGDTQNPYTGIVTHSGELEKGEIYVGDKLEAVVDDARRQKIANNHTATHLFHWALREVLGPQVRQAGSVVDPDRLRFDFNHHKALTNEEIHQIEDLVNAKIRENTPVDNYELSYQDAQKRKDIIQFFGEKYGSTVRVVDVDASKELCGGIHTTATGKIGYFRITKESSIAAGVRRIEGVTGANAEAFARDIELVLEGIASQLKTPTGKVVGRIQKLQEENKDLAQQVKAAKKGQLTGLASTLLGQAETIGSVQLIAAEVSVPSKELADFADMVMEKLQSGVVVLATTADSRCNIVACVSQDCIIRLAPSFARKPATPGARHPNPSGVKRAQLERKRPYKLLT